MAAKTFMSRFTLLQQWAVATVLAIIPLLAAVSYAAFALQDQARQQRLLMQRMDLVTTHGATLSKNSRELVRLARQYALLLDTSFLDLYSQKVSALDESATALGALLDDDTVHSLLNSMSQAARDADELMSSSRQFNQESLSGHLQSLVNSNDELVQETNRYRLNALATGEQEFRGIVNQLFFLTAMALPGTFLLMIIGTFMVSRPLWRLSQAIRQLGQQQWEKPIRIRGPADLVALGDNLEWMRQQVWASDRQKNAFIQHVTHELKTPLAAIIEAGNLLHEEVPGPLLASQHAVLDILRTNSRSLEHLIQQLLNYNAVSHGVVSQWQDIHLPSLCQSIRATLESATPDKKLNWRFEGSPEQIRSDHRLLEMILKNLLGNALQFTPPGGQIIVSWEKHQTRWTLCVSDSGPGIPEDELDHLYVPFFQGRTGRKSKVPKTGMGLAIVYECVNLLKGEILATSPPNQGTTFTMTFPVIAGEKP